MANVDGQKGFWPVRFDGSDGIPTVKVTLTSGQTVAAGDALEISSGKAIIATVNSDFIYGVAAEACTATADTVITCWPALPGMVFKGQTATGTNFTFTTHAYNWWDITGGTGAMELDISASPDEDVVYIIEVEDGNTDGEAHANVYFQFIRSSYCPLLAAGS